MRKKERKNNLHSSFKNPKKEKNQITIIAAIDAQRGIGNKNKLLFSLKRDIQRFKKITTGGIVIMGSKTYNSIPQKFRPLKNRINIVLSRKEDDHKYDNLIVVHSLEEAMKIAQSFHKKIWVIGGASIYTQFLPFADNLEITQIFTKREADAYFPRYEENFKLQKKSKKYFDEREQVFYQFQKWVKKEKE